MKLQDMLKWLESKLGCGYVYGATGQICTQALLDRLEKQWGSSHRYAEAKKWIGKQVFDCVNLIKDCRRELDGEWEDVSAHGLFHMCKPLPMSEARTGDLVFRVKNNHAEHVGVVVAPGLVIEAKGTSYGVVKTKLPGTWTHAARNVWLDPETAITDQTVLNMVADGVINSPEHWQQVLSGQIPAKPEYLRKVLDAYHAR